MKAIDLLFWIIRESINGEFLNFVFVPKEGEKEYEQNEEWWMRGFGACPPYPIPEGKYVVFYCSEVDNTDITDGDGAYYAPDAMIETDDDTICLYKIND